MWYMQLPSTILIFFSLSDYLTTSMTLSVSSWQAKIPTPFEPSSFPLYHSLYLSSPSPNDVVFFPLYRTSYTQQISALLLLSISKISLPFPFSLPIFTVHTLNFFPSPQSCVRRFNLGVPSTLCPFKGCQGLRAIDWFCAVIEFWSSGFLCAGCPSWRATLPIYPGLGPALSHAHA